MIDRMTSIYDRDRQIAWHKLAGHTIIRYWQDVNDPATWYIEWSGTVVRMWPAEVTKEYSLKVYSEAEEKAVMEFLGIEPAGLTITRYLETLDRAGLEKWRSYWINIFSGLKRADIVDIVNKKAGEYLEKLKPTPAPAPAPTPPAPIAAIIGRTDIAAKVQEYLDANYPTDKRMQDAIMIGVAGALAASAFVGGMILAGGFTAAETGAGITTQMAAEKVAQKTAIALLKESIKKNPVIVIFAATEIPNLIVMAQFARNQIAQEAGTTFQQLSFKLSDYETALKEGGYAFNNAIKAKDYTLATTIITNMQTTLDAYEKTINENNAELKEKDSYDNVYFLFTTYRDAIEANKTKIPVTAIIIPSALPESIDVQITAVTDADTVTATATDINKTVYDVRILGMNAPDKNLGIYWVKSLIAGVETRFELASKNYKAANAFAVTNLWRAYATLKIDPANKTDKYGRVLAAIIYQNGTRNFAEDLVEKGLAVPYFEGTNKYVDIASITAKSAAAQAAGLGLWPAATTAVTPTTPGAVMPANTTAKFKVLIDSDPSNAKLYIDNVDVHHRTPSNEVELKKQLYLLTVGTHVIKVTKGTKTNYMEATQEVNIIDGDNGSILLTLKYPGLIG